MKEKKDRVDDALAATRAAVEEGIVPGGGVAYIRATAALEGMKGANEDQTTGIQIVKRAIEEPLRQIVENAGGEGSVVVNKVKEGKDAFGYNARDDKYEDLLKAGIIDPTKVSRVALENAASIASMFLTTECVLAEKKSDASRHACDARRRYGRHDVIIGSQYGKPEPPLRLRFFCREAVEAAFSGAAGGWPGGVPPGAAGTSLAAGLFLSAHLRFGIYHMPAEPICAPANCPACSVGCVFVAHAPGSYEPGVWQSEMPSMR